MVLRRLSNADLHEAAKYFLVVPVVVVPPKKPQDNMACTSLLFIACSTQNRMRDSNVMGPLFCSEDVPDPTHGPITGLLPKRPSKAQGRTEQEETTSECQFTAEQP